MHRGTIISGTFSLFLFLSVWVSLLLLIVNIASTHPHPALQVLWPLPMYGSGYIFSPKFFTVRKTPPFGQSHWVKTLTLLRTRAGSEWAKFGLFSRWASQESFPSGRVGTRSSRYSGESLGSVRMEGRTPWLGMGGRRMRVRRRVSRGRSERCSPSGDGIYVGCIESVRRSSKSVAKILCFIQGFP